MLLDQLVEDSGGLVPGGPWIRDSGFCGACFTAYTCDLMRSGRFHAEKTEVPGKMAPEQNIIHFVAQQAVVDVNGHAALMDRVTETFPSWEYS